MKLGSLDWAHANLDCLSIFSLELRGPYGGGRSLQSPEWRGLDCWDL